MGEEMQCDTIIWMASINFVLNLVNLYWTGWLVVDQRRIEERYSVLLKGVDT